MSIFESIVNHFNDHLDITSRNIESLTPHIAEATHLFTEALLADKKIFCCTSGDSFAAGHQFCHNLLNNTGLQRPGLPALFLGSDSNSMLSMLNNHTADDIFSRKILALGNKDDVLLVISSAGNEQSLIHALAAAMEKQMPIVALISSQHADLISKISDSNVIIAIQSDTIQKIIPIQYLVSILLAALIEQQLFGAL